MLLKEVLSKSIQFFKDKKIESSRLEAELLISHALKIERIALYIKYDQPLSDEEVQLCRDFIRRRSLGEPVAYITEEKGFFTEVFKVLPGVLVPRPETEILVEEVLKFVEKNKIESPQILDLGAGTGCIGLSIIKKCPQATLVSIDISEVAVENVKINVEKLNLKDRVTIIQSSTEYFDWSSHKFDCIVANPPYISKNDPDIESQVKRFEPASALFAENNGFLFLKNWSKLGVSSLKQPSLMAFEMGHLQGPEMEKHFKELNVFSRVEVLKDLAGKDRIIKGIIHG